MASTQSSSAPRFVSYCCSHSYGPVTHDDGEILSRWMPMTLLTEPGQRVTHVNLGQWWWAPDRSRSTLFYNDNAWKEPNSDPLNMKDDKEKLNDRVYSEVKQLQAKGIKVLTQLTFFWTNEGFGQEGAFNEHLYGLLHEMLTNSGFDGVDLDVEDHATDNTKVIRLIRRLKKDFGSEFLITFAPGGRELLAPGAPGHGALSGIVYKDLYEEIGSEIAWFNVQLYNSWGSLSLSDFEKFICAGLHEAVYPANKIVMLVASNPTNTENGDWTDGATLEKNLPEILAAYPDMGGLGCWEWYNATLKTPEPKTAVVHHPMEWFRAAHRLLYADAEKLSAAALTSSNIENVTRQVETLGGGHLKV